LAIQTELIRVVQSLSFCQDLDSVMAVLREEARQLTRADGVTVVLRDGDQCHYAEESAIAPLWKGRRFPMKACISGWCMLHREQVVIPDIYADPRIPHDAYRPTFVKSLAMTPIRTEDPVGAIGAYWADPHQATTEELQILQDLGVSAAMALANVQLIAELRAANRRKDEFLSMLAHELRNPLAPLRNALHVLRLRGGEKEAVEQAGELMERQVQHLAHMVDDLLDVARFTSGKIALRRERLNLARVVRHAVEDRRSMMEEAGISLELELPEIPVWVTGDATRLAQVLGNVLDNARKFTPAGGGVTVQLSLEKPERQAVVAVRDTGIGIEAKLLPEIFEVFAQADRSLDRTSGGLGLGLAVAKGLLDLHSGTIEARSAGIGQGAEFILRLPHDQELPALAEGPGTSRTAQNPLRVLVVEDNRDSAEALRMLLEICGYEVMVAFSGTEGVEIAQAARPDAVVCDIGLPGMDGFTVAEHLRRSPETAAARLIAVTGYGQEEDRQRALEAGFDVHLVKPVEPGKLLEHLVCDPAFRQSAGEAPGGFTEQNML
jgi:signal transduction histidine kinase/ActR/RegA family two-component response regulator